MFEGAIGSDWRLSPRLQNSRHPNLTSHAGIQLQSQSRRKLKNNGKIWNFGQPVRKHLEHPFFKTREPASSPRIEPDHLFA